MSERITLAIDEAHSVSGLLEMPPMPRALFVLAHGAGAGMQHAFLEGAATGLADRDIATLRFQFPFMERGGRRVDSPAVSQSAVRAAVAEAHRLYPRMPLFAGGRSFGGRMTSQAQAAAPLDHVRGIAFLGFPLRGAGKPSDERAAHLMDVRIPMLFLQGTRDELADLGLLRPVIDSLGADASLVTFEHADHAFHVPAKSGRTDAQVHTELLDVLATWIKERSP